LLLNAAAFCLWRQAAAGSVGTLEFGLATAMVFIARFVTGCRSRRGDRPRQPQLRRKRDALKKKTAKLQTV